jgi:hypothetical protein
MLVLPPLHHPVPQLPDKLITHHHHGVLVLSSTGREDVFDAEAEHARKTEEQIRVRGNNRVKCLSPSLSS